MSNRNSVDGSGAKPLTERVLKWVAAISAILSLVFAIQKLVQVIADNSDRSRH